MAKTDLTDVTFLSLIKLDSIDRLENILLVTDYINKHFKTNILVLEVDAYNNGILSRLLSRNLNVSFIENYDPIFHRTHYLNKIVKMATTPIISLWDSDVMVHKKQIEDSVSFIRKNEADFVLPYSGSFLDTSMIVKELYIKRKDFNVFIENKNKMKELYGPNPVGGALFAKQKTYIDAGMENENFYGWGNHDGERINRWNKLDYKVRRIAGPIFHLSHSRSINSVYHSNKQRELKIVELERLAMMSKSELIAEISKWNQ